MSKIAHYLQEHLVGEVVTSADARRYFATDASILSLVPSILVYPRNENDVRKIARFTWQLAERGRVIPLTARGAGTDQTGAALGSGIMLVFPAHLNRILELDTKAGTVTVEPGINYGKLQQTLHTHGRFLPPYPASLEYSTIGGAIGNNASGEKSVKYGDTRNFVTGLRVVLANGEIIQTGRLSKRELAKKLGLATFEGEIYRQIDTLLEEQHEALEKLSLPVSRNSAGYSLHEIKQRDGSFDLTPLFVGSQGTLGIITEATLSTEPLNPETNLLVATFDNLGHAQSAITELRDSKEPPSAIEMVDGNLLTQVQAINPNQLKEAMQPPFAPLTLFIEFDTPADRQLKKAVRRAQKILDRYATGQLIETQLEAQQALWKVRQASAAILGQDQGQQRALPLIEDASVPVDKFNEYLSGVYSLCQKLDIKPAVWGHAGDGVLHLQPQLNVAQIGDRQKAFRLMDDYYKLVLSLGGSIAGEHAEGRIKAPYLALQFGNDVYALFGKLKLICDPYGTLNPGVKLGTTQEDIKTMLRPDYSLVHLYDHLPRT